MLKSVCLVCAACTACTMSCSQSWVVGDSVCFWVCVCVCEKVANPSPWSPCWRVFPRNARYHRWPSCMPERNTADMYSLHSSTQLIITARNKIQPQADQHSQTHLFALPRAWRWMGDKFDRTMAAKRERLSKSTKSLFCPVQRLSCGNVCRPGWLQTASLPVCTSKDRSL